MSKVYKKTSIINFPNTTIDTSNSFVTGTKSIRVDLSGATSNTTTTVTGVGSQTLTLPAATTTIVGTTTTQTLTNKTLTTPVMDTILNTGTVTLPTGPDTLATTTGTQTWTNKTFAYQVPALPDVNSTGLAVGTGAGRNNVASAPSIYVGRDAGRICTTNNNVVLGANSFANTTTSTENVIIGTDAANSVMTSNVANTFVGRYTGSSYTTSTDSNVLVGYRAGESLTTRGGSTFVGNEAGRYANGNSNVFVGNGSGRGTSSVGNTTTQNTAIGNNTMTNISQGARNCAVGHDALLSLTTGSDNTCIGYNAGRLITTANGNVLIGSECGSLMAATSALNTCIGRLTGNSISGGIGNTFIGNSAGSNLVNPSYRLSIAHNGMTLVTGEIGNNTLRFDADTTIETGKKITLTGSTSGSVSLIASAVTSNWTLTLPNTVPPSTSHILVTDGTGVSRWDADTDPASLAITTHSSLSNLTLTVSMDFIIFDDATGATLPSAASNGGKVYTFFQRANSTSTVTASGSDTIMGLATANIAPFESLQIMSDGVANWIRS